MQHALIFHAFPTRNARTPRITGWTVRLRFALALLIILAGLQSGGATAQLTLTPATAAAGWTLTHFATGFKYDKYGIGPFGIAFKDDGSLLVTDSAGEVLLFPTDTDGQDASKVPVGHSYGYFNSGGLVRVGNRFFVAQFNNNLLVEINGDGTLKQSIAGWYHIIGLAVNPNNGHLFASSGNRNYIADFDPVAKKGVALLTLPYGEADGLATDGVTLYAASGGHVLGYRLSDKKLVFDSGFILGTDGIALGTGSLAGFLFVNTNNGQVFQIDLSSQVITLIASGGGRGDFVTVDPNGTLLITQSAWIARLTPPQGDTFESATVAVAPATVAGGVNAQGTVTLSLPAPNNVVVALASTNAAASVPSTVTVPAGALSAPFAITTAPVSASVNGAIKATLNGITASAPLTVRPLGVASLTLKPTTVQGGGSVTGTVTLEAAAGPAAITVTFGSSDTNAVPTPVAVTVPKGATTATFTVNTKKVTASKTVTLSATANQVSSSATLTVTP